MLKEMSNDELLNVDGGIGLFTAIAIGTGCVLVGTALGLGTAYVVSKI